MEHESIIDFSICLLGRSNRKANANVNKLILEKGGSVIDYTGLLGAIRLLIILPIVRGLTRTKRFRIFCPNLKKTISRLFIAMFGKYDLVSFDDGIGNVSGSGYFYEHSEVRTAKKLIERILGVMGVRPYKEVVSAVTIHYSIYRFENVYEKITVRLSLEFSLGETGKDFSGQEVTYFLGSPLSEDGIVKLSDELEIIRELDKVHKIDFYIMHPRERGHKTSALYNVVVLDDFRIAEQIVVDKVLEGVKVKLIGINSTALINLAACDGVRCFYVKSKKIPLPSALHDIFQKSKIEEIELLR